MQRKVAPPNTSLVGGKLNIVFNIAMLLYPEVVWVYLLFLMTGFFHPFLNLHLKMPSGIPHPNVYYGWSKVAFCKFSKT